MAEPPDDLVDKAIRHQLRARAVSSDPSSAFLLSTSPSHSKFCQVPKPSKKLIVTAVQRNINDARNQPRSEREATRVFLGQNSSQITTTVYNTFSTPTASGDHNGPHPLPGGAALIDHVAAFLTTAPDWQEIEPHIIELRSSRLPSSADAENWLELTLGISSTEEWESANHYLQEKSRQDLGSLYPFWAADTESVGLKITWPTPPRTSVWESLLAHISAESRAGKSQVEFTVAPDGCSACSIPVRFLLGSATWHLHTRLPVNYYRSRGEEKMVLKLDTTLNKETEQLFLAQGPMVGAGITEDYVEWSAILHAIWQTRFFEKMALPIELEHLARAARLNTLNSSVFHTNWWCLGTVLPKILSSLGDKKWGRPMEEIPHSLKRYLAGDIVQTVKIASLLVLIWIIQSFPDMTVIRDATKLSVVEFVRWTHQFVFRKLFAGIKSILKDADGHWWKVSPQQAWIEQPTVEMMMTRLNPPSLKEHPLIWNPPGWPSITCGGPRSLLEARASIVDRLDALHRLDHESWMAPHADKMVLWKFGVAKEINTAITTPVPSLGLLLPTSVKSHLNINPELWDKDQLKQSSTTNERSDRALILEFVRLYPSKALKVLNYVENHRTKFRNLVNESRTLKIVIDLRDMLTFLNYKVLRPVGWTDPYNVKEYYASLAAKQTRHEELRLKKLLEKDSRLQETIASTKRNLESLKRAADSANHDEATEPARKVHIREDNSRTVRFRTTEEVKTLTQDLVSSAQKSSSKQDVSTPIIQQSSASNVIVLKAKSYAEVVTSKPVKPTSFSTKPGPLKITPPMLNIIRQALTTNERDFINPLSKVRIHPSDIQSATGDRWLNDSTISAYFELIQQRGATDDLLPKVVALNTFFYPILEKLGHNNVRRFTNKIDLFEHDLVLIPIHLGTHWALVGADLIAMTVTYYDSYIKSYTNSKPADIVVKFLEQEYEAKKGIPLGIKVKSCWNQSIPQQDNDNDCGMFVCILAEHLAREAAMEIQPQHIPVYRQLLIWEIASNRLLNQHVADVEDTLILGINNIAM